MQLFVLKGGNKKTVARRILFAIMIILCPKLTLSQNIVTHEFSLKGEITNLNKEISYVSIVDSRSNKDCFGYIYGNGTRNKLIVTDTVFQVALGKFANRHFTSQVNNDADTLLCVIRELSVEYNSGSSKLSAIYMNADFFLGRRDRYAHVYHIDSFCQLSPRNLIGVLGYFDKLISNCFIEAHHNVPFVSSQQQYSYANAIRLPDMEKENLPLYQVSTYRKGIYRNWEAFLKQIPSDTNFATISDPDVSKKSPSFYSVNSNGNIGVRIPADSYYAVYDGKWYKSEYYDVVSMARVNNDFVATVKIGKNTYVEEGITTMFGIAGYAFYNLATADSHSETLRNGKYRMKLDYKTGKFIPIKMLQ